MNPEMTKRIEELKPVLTEGSWRTNREYRLAYHKWHYHKTKDRYYKDQPWVVKWWSARHRCRTDKHYSTKGIKCKLTKEEIKELWFRYKAYKFKVPSLDRIDNDGDYTFQNCRFIENVDNIKRGLRVQKWGWYKHGFCKGCGTNTKPHYCKAMCQDCYCKHRWQKDKAKKLEGMR